VIAGAALLGLYVQRTRGIGQKIETNMLIGNTRANLDHLLSYEGKPPRPLVDTDLHGLGALYRLYPAVGAGYSLPVSRNVSGRRCVVRWSGQTYSRMPASVRRRRAVPTTPS
jgi:hypothetical protein